MVTSVHRRIMIINGDPGQSKFISDTMISASMNVVVFGTAREALISIDDGITPDLVIIDLHSTDIDGWRFCRLLRSPVFPMASATPILVTSGIYSGVDVLETSRDLGANDFLSMPCEKKLLLDVVSDAFAGRKRIIKPLALIIEDDVDAVRMVRTVLESRGYDVVATDKADDARELFATRNPNVVLLDHHLDGFKGSDLLREFKALSTHAAVIAITGDLSVDLALEYASAGVDAVVHKPFSLQHLSDVLVTTRRQRDLLRAEELMAQRTNNLKETYEKIMDASRLASLGELAAEVAHEINNPIAGMMNCAEILESELEEGSENHEFAKMIVDDGKRVAAIVRRLSGFSSLQKEERVPQDVAGIVMDAVDFVKPHLVRSSIRLDCEVNVDVFYVTCGRTLIQQAIMNLLLNACDALDKRYPQNDKDKVLRIKVYFRNDSNGDYVVVSIEDFGHGIPADDIPMLFDPFFTTKQAGTGLGLPISNGIVRAHGGRIDVESVVGSFTRFDVCLPVEDESGIVG